VTHRLQLFDTPESLADTVAAFLLDGYSAGENLLIVAKPENREAIFARLLAAGCFPPDELNTPRMVALDAAEVLEQIARGGRIELELFERAVTPIVQALAASGPLRIYGEIVELCAEEDELEAALTLERLWNTLSDRVSFTLMCGYSSAHFTRAHCKLVLRDICNSHTHVGADLLAT
jgi:hypothetical protein